MFIFTSDEKCLSFPMIFGHLLVVTNTVLPLAAVLFLPFFYLLSFIPGWGELCSCTRYAGTKSSDLFLIHWKDQLTDDMKHLGGGFSHALALTGPLAMPVPWQTCTQHSYEMSIYIGRCRATGCLHKNRNPDCLWFWDLATHLKTYKNIAVALRPNDINKAGR